MYVESVMLRSDISSYRFMVALSLLPSALLFHLDFHTRPEDANLGVVTMENLEGYDLHTKVYFPLQQV